MEAALMSLDLGTTNLKLTYFANKKALESKTYSYRQAIKSKEAYQLDWEEMLSLVKEGLMYFYNKYQFSRCDLILTSAMHSLILFDEFMQAQSPVYTWADPLGQACLPENPSEGMDLYLHTGTPCHPMNPYYKVKDLIKDGREIRRIGSIKDGLLFFLTGDWVLDLACASSTGMLDLGKARWSKRCLTDLGIELEQLPRIVEAWESLPLVADHFSLPFEATVYPGFSDGVSSNGAYLGLKGVAVCSFGTSHAVRVFSNKVKLNPVYQNFAYVWKKGSYLLGLPSNNGGNVLDDLADQYGMTMEELAYFLQSPQAVKGVYLPYHYGERAPIWKREAQAYWHPLVANLSLEEELYAKICGVFFNLKMNVETLAKLTGFEAIALTGGITKSLSFCQFIANVLQYPIYVADRDAIETYGSLRLLGVDQQEETYHSFLPQENEYLQEGYLTYCSVCKDLYPRLKHDKRR